MVSWRRILLLFFILRLTFLKTFSAAEKINQFLFFCISSIPENTCPFSGYAMIVSEDCQIEYLQGGIGKQHGSKLLTCFTVSTLIGFWIKHKKKFVSLNCHEYFLMLKSFVIRVAAFMTMFHEEGFSYCTFQGSWCFWKLFHLKNMYKQFHFDFCSHLFLKT